MTFTGSALRTRLASGIASKRDILQLSLWTINKKTKKSQTPSHLCISPYIVLLFYQKECKQFLRLFHSLPTAVCPFCFQSSVCSAHALLLYSNTPLFPNHFPCVFSFQLHIHFLSMSPLGPLYLPWNLTSFRYLALHHIILFRLSCLFDSL